MGDFVQRELPLHLFSDVPYQGRAGDDCLHHLSTRETHEGPPAAGPSHATFGVPSEGEPENPGIKPELVMYSRCIIRELLLRGIKQSLFNRPPPELNDLIYYCVPLLSFTHKVSLSLLSLPEIEPFGIGGLSLPFESLWPDDKSLAPLLSRSVCSPAISVPHMQECGRLYF